MHALDASVDPMAGQVDLHFEAADPTRSVTATFAGIRGKSAPQPDDAQYKLVTAADHSSGFAYSTHVDFDGDGTQDQIAHIDSQWSPTGAGVAHLMSSTAALELAWSTRSNAGTRRWLASTPPTTPPCTLLPATPPVARRSGDAIAIALRSAAKSTIRTAPTPAQMYAAPAPERAGKLACPNA